ncbi:MAG TPA: methyltransferase domain-containing protein [Polyangiaceae bacterium]|nr:methyltransferase domain-containing protein [Polyangiaceae bacterium]
MSEDRRDGASVLPREPEDESRPLRPSSSPAARRRARVGLRIPDDEITRPQPPVAEIAARPAVPRPTSPEPAGEVVKPMRIITINPPPVAEAPLPPAVPPPASVPEVDGWDAPVSVDTEDDEERDEPTIPHLPAAPSTPRQVAEPEESDVRFDDEVPTPLLPAVAADGERRSDPGDAPEISAEDLVAVEAAPAILRADLPPARSHAPSHPSHPPLPRPNKPSVPPGRPPLVIIPPHVGTFAPAPESIGVRRKGRLWWEDFFNDDFLRTTEKTTDEQILREVGFMEDALGIERGGALLDLACGTGRHAIELARRGYEVVGFDLSLAMLARAGEEAQDRGTKINFVQGDMREMAFEEQFDGVYSWNTSFGYFEEDKNAQVVDRVHRALKSGGLFLLDVVNRDFLVRQSPSLAWFEGDGCVCMDEMAIDFISSRMRVKRTMMLDDGRTREVEYSMRVYSLHELGRILHEHGFKVCEVTGRIATPGVFFGNESPRTIILAEKR